MNFVFISPNFPKNYWNFCRGLKNNGINVLGIGDEEYNSLSEELKNNLKEYYKVSSLENYDEVHRACGYFIHKYGKIDWLESNNEYWLLRDAELRTDFNINTGLKNNKIAGIKYKSSMKEFYKKAGVKTARYHIVNSYDEGKKFIELVGYPVVVKPNNGVGAADTYKIENDNELKNFYKKLPMEEYIMEEYINGELLSYDGIAGKNKEIIFETAHRYPIPVMELVNNQEDVMYYSYKNIPEDLKKAGEKVVKSFNSNSRFFHCEFFRLLEDKVGLGKKGDIIGLEVNMRPPGGYTLDMMNYAKDIDVYQIWANMIAYNEGFYDRNKKNYITVYAARRKGNKYAYSLTETKNKYKDNIVMVENMPEVFATAMGDYMVTARFDNEKDCDDFIKFYLAKGDK